jgi:hypothetical protein
LRAENRIPIVASDSLRAAQIDVLPVPATEVEHRHGRRHEAIRERGACRRMAVLWRATFLGVSDTACALWREVTVRPRQANSTLADLPHQTEYRSDCHELVRGFYLPCLTHSTLYRRAAGYRTRRGLSVAAQGLTAPIHGGGVTP